MDAVGLQIIFFDLGDTLVERDPTASGGLRFRWLPNAQDTLRELSSAGLRIGLISNTGDFDRAALSAMLPADFTWEIFDLHLVVLSKEVGFKKPDLRIFRLALTEAQEHGDPAKRLRIDPAETLFCGEDLLETLAAQQVGMRTARIRSGANSDLGDLPDRLRKASLLQ